MVLLWNPRVDRQRGGALAAALMAVTVIAFLGAGLIQVAGAQLQRHSRAIETKQAFYVAEAGLSEAWFAIAQGKSGNIASAGQPSRLNNGLFWVEANWLPEGLVELSATGLSGGGRAAIEIIVERPTNPYAELGVFGENGVMVRRMSVVDGWDAANGEYVKPYLREKGEDFPVRVHSNGDVTAKGISTDPLEQTKVFGDLRPGKDGTVTLGSGVLVTGSTAPKSAPETIPEVQVPSVTLGRATVLANDTTLSGDTLGIEALAVGPGVTLTLVGPLELVVGSLTVDATGGVVIDGSAGPVALYVDGPVSMPAGSTLNTVSEVASAAALFLLEEHSAEQLAMTKKTALDFAPSGEFFGMLIAPEAFLMLPAELRVHGSVAAKDLELAQGSRVTFDLEALHNATGGAGMPLLISWRVIELPDVEIVRQRSDPVAQLAMSGVTPLTPTEGHWEQEIDLVYLDSVGARSTYSGDVAGLDWSTVDQVLSKVWTDSPAPVDGVNAQKTADLLSGADSSAIKAKLIAASPLGSDELYQAILLDPPLESSDLKAVLELNSPLRDHVLLKSTDVSTSSLNSSDLKSVLLANSPLPGSVLVRLDETSLSASDKLEVLAAQ